MKIEDTFKIDQIQVKVCEESKEEVKEASLNQEDVSMADEATKPP